VTKASGASAAPRSSPSRSSTKGGSSTAAKTKPAAKKPQPIPPETPGIARIIAIANQKGGVGKSTTAVSLGASLADLGYRVLVIDLDPQGNASTGMGIKHEARETTVYDVIVAEAPVGDAIVQTPVARLHAIPSTIDLAGAEIELVSQFSRETRLKKAVSVIREGVYDFVLLDCPPSLGLLTINALTAAEELIVPIQCEYYALEGVGQLLRNVSLVQQNINPGLRLTGIVMTMFDPRTKLSEQVVEEVQRFFGDLVYDVIIPRTVRLSEAPGYGQPITVYDPKSKGAECYRELGREVALRPPPTGPMPVYDDLPSVVLPAVADTITQDRPVEPLDEEDLDELPTVRAVIDADTEVEAGPDEETEAAEEALETSAELADEAAAEADSSAETMEAVEDVAPEAASTPEPARELEPEPATEPPAPVSGGAPSASADPGAMEDVDDDDELWEDGESNASSSRVAAPRSPAPPGHLPERRVVVIDEGADMATPDPSRPEPSADASDPQADESHAAVADIGATLEDEDDSRKRRWRLFRKGGE
jgi:chromosome partitioning protein